MKDVQEYVDEILDWDLSRRDEDTRRVVAAFVRRVRDDAFEFCAQLLESNEYGMTDEQAERLMRLFRSQKRIQP